jgi:hypothetical protein
MRWVRWLATGAHKATLLERLELSRRIHNRCLERFGANDPLTLNAAHNLGVSLRLSGLVAEARDRDTITYQREAEVLGVNHPFTLLTGAGLALDQRELGEYYPADEAFKEIVTRHRNVFGTIILQR